MVCQRLGVVRLNALEEGDRTLVRRNLIQAVVQLR